MATLGRPENRLRAVGVTAVALILSGLCIDAIDRHSPGGGNPVSRALVAASSPFMKLGSSLHRGAEHTWNGIFGSQRLAAENDELRQELMELRIKASIERSEGVLAERRAEISTNLPSVGSELIAAPVLAGPASPGRRVLWIGAGVEQGVRSGMIVLGPHGIIGSVADVHASTALVELVTDHKAAWGAQVAGSNELGLLRGTGDPLKLELHFDRTVAKVAEGQAIISSGMSGSIAPGGIPFGEVDSVALNKQGEPVAVVRLPDDPTAMRTVFILPLDRVPQAPTP